MRTPGPPILATSSSRAAAKAAATLDPVPLLEIKGLKTHFKTDDGWLHAVDGVDLVIDRGQTVCVVGESGCGKTVTAMTVMKLVPMPPGRIVAGQVLWQGRDLVSASSDEMRRIRAKEIAIIFQEPMTSLNPVYSIGEQIAESLRLHEGLGAQGRARARGRDAGAGADPDAAAPRPRLPAPVLGRHAPAGDDRDRPGVQSRSC